MTVCVGFVYGIGNVIADCVHHQYQLMSDSRQNTHKILQTLHYVCIKCLIILNHFLFGLLFQS